MKTGPLLGFQLNNTAVIFWHSHRLVNTWKIQKLQIICSLPEVHPSLFQKAKS